MRARSRIASPTCWRASASPPDHADRYPHEFSGGQRQRIGIARALILRPKLVICDEPVSALDVSIRAQIINLLLELKESLGLSYIMISHDLGVVEHMSDRVAVMYLGKIVETGDWRAIFERPGHPYTRGLIAAIPDAFAPAEVAANKVRGEIPSPFDPPSGCAFHPRCPIVGRQMPRDARTRTAPRLRRPTRRVAGWRSARSFANLQIYAVSNVTAIFLGPSLWNPKKQKLQMPANRALASLRGNLCAACTFANLAADRRSNSCFAAAAAVYSWFWGRQQALSVCRLLRH